MSRNPSNMWKRLFTLSAAESAMDVSSGSDSQEYVIEATNNQTHVTLLHIENISKAQHALIQVSTTIYFGLGGKCTPSIQCRTGAVPVLSSTVDINDMFVFDLDELLNSDELYIGFEVIDKRTGVIGIGRTKDLRLFSAGIEQEENIEILGKNVGITLVIRIGVRGQHFIEIQQNKMFEGL
jgi:hypothetical protein